MPEEPVKEETKPKEEPEKPVEDEPEPEEEPTVEPGEPEEDEEPHPLEPEGKRFRQVYAEKKQLELELAQTKGELAAVKKPVEETKPREYTEEELDTIEERAHLAGDKATLKAVNQYRIQREVRTVVAQQQIIHGRTQLAQELGKRLFTEYPDLQNPGSQLFKAASEEYATLGNEYRMKGLDITQDVHATELAVGRALRKSPALAKRVLKEATVGKKAAAPADTFVTEGTHAPRKEGTVGSAKLTQRELDFCRRSGMDPKEYSKHKVERKRG